MGVRYMYQTDEEKVQHLQQRGLLQRFVPGENVRKPSVQMF